MVGVFVRLKLRLLVNGLRGSRLRTAGFIIGCLYSLGIGVAAFAGFLAVRNRPTDLGVAAELTAVAVAVGWAALPILGFGSDETLDPTRLALLPLPRRELMTGLLAATLVGPAAVATAIGLAGATVALLPASPGAVLVVVAATVQLLAFVALSRAVVTALSAALRSRKGRDLRIVVVALIAFAPQALRLVLGRARLTDIRAMRPWAHSLSWLPPTLPARAMVAARGGHWAAAVVELAGGGVTVALLVLWWSRSLDSVMTTAEAQGNVTSAPPPVRQTPLFDPGLGLLPRTRTGAVTARELRYTWREPRRRVQLVAGLVLPLILLAGVVSRGGLHHHDIVYAALLVAFLAGNNRAVNQFGLDGAAFWVHEAAGQDLRADLTGKNLAVAFTTLPLSLLTAVVLAAISGGWVELAVTACTAVALVALLLGVGDVASILLPIPAPDSPTNVWGSQSGQGCSTGLLSLTVLGVEAALAAPMVLGLVVHGPARLAVVIGILVYGAVLHLAGLTLAVRVGAGRGPELLEKIGPRQSG